MPERVVINAKKPDFEKVPDVAAFKAEVDASVADERQRIRFHAWVDLMGLWATGMMEQRNRYREEANAYEEEMFSVVSKGDLLDFLKDVRNGVRSWDEMERVLEL